MMEKEKDKIRLNADEEFDDKIYRVKRKKNTSLATSNNDSKAYRANLLNDKTNKPEGFGELYEVDPKEFEKEIIIEKEVYREPTFGEQLAQGLGELAAQFVIDVSVASYNEIIKPVAKMAWNEYIAPKAKQAIDEYRSGKSHKKKTRAEMILSAKKDVDNKQKSINERGDTQLAVSDKVEDKAILITKNQAAFFQAKKLWNEIENLKIDYLLQHSQIADVSNLDLSDGIDTNATLQLAFQKLLIPENLNYVNSILSENIGSYNELENEISKYLNRELVVNGEYSSISCHEVSKIFELESLEIEDQ
ncbi:hypothetical protein [Ileibacterium valens]|uniref:hypothetical protein n=1 Tax=Ileibacterium valens TaxID=1862668 RepID=UPI002357B796|nr:hypothetical protein [Ileibacterium valens]